MSDLNQPTKVLLRSLSAAIAILITGVGVMVFGAWLFHLETLNGFLPSLARMKINTALCFILAGGSFWSLRQASLTPLRRRISQLAALVVLAISLLTLGEYLFGVHFAIDEWLRKDLSTVIDPGRMGYNTAISFILVSLALLLLDIEPTHTFPPAQLLAPCAMAISALALIGYVYDLEPLYGATNYTSVSLHTAISFVLLSAAILAARPEQRLTTALIAAANRLTVRIVVLVVVAVLLCGGTVSALLVDRGHDQIRAQIIADNLDSADLAARFASRYIEGARMNLDYLGQSPTIVHATLRGDFPTVTGELQQFLAINRRFDGCTLIDLKGSSRATGNRAFNNATNVSDRDYFQQVIQTGKPYLGLPVLSRGTKTPAVPYAVPILDDNFQVHAVLVGGISLTALNEAITNFRGDSASRTSLSDLRSGGITLAHSDRARLLKRVSASNQAVSFMLKGERGAMETTDSSGVSFLAAFSPVPNLPWGVLVLHPSEAAFAPVAVGVRRSLLAIATMMLVSVLVSAWLARQLTLPIRGLRDTAAALAAGDLTRRAHVQRHDEVGELGRVFDHMADALGERTGQLIDANKQLEAYSYSVSHDLRAPLRAITGFARILDQEHADSLSPEGRRYLGLISKNTIRMGQLIEDMLAFSRLRVCDLHKTEVDPSQLARQSFDDQQLDREGRKVDFVIGALPACQADPGLLKQVWTNLISNALKFTSSRPIARIEIGCVRGTDAYYVKDNGVGFDMRYADKLFGAFQRLHGFDEFDGTGVGLAIVQRVVQRHGGEVWAESELDKGATFYFTLGGAISRPTESA